jgi:FkbM family methyltransferase
MASLASRVGQLLPEGNLKNNLRLIGFKVLFTTIGTKKVFLGTNHDKVPARISRLVLTHESLGTRENEGYLQHYQLKTGDVVVNAGSYHGYFAIYAARKVGPSGRVICFEPEPNNRRLLLQNISLNSLSNITVIPAGLWSTDTRLPLISMGSGSRLQPDTSWDKQTISVCTLDTALTKLHASTVNLLTMDIEGAEIEALKGARLTLANNRDIHIAIASYHRVNGHPTAPYVEELLRQANLYAETSYPRHLTTYGYYRHS